MSNEKTLQAGLAEIQRTLKVAKNQRNNFGNYNYRSCEDILEALKPLLNGYTLIISDEVVSIGERYYVKATAHLGDGKEVINATAYAREAEEKKGMDVAQITGAASSYARKYALNGLFAIDDTKDADTDEIAKVSTHKEPTGVIITSEEPPMPEEEMPSDKKVCSAHDEPVVMFEGKSKTKKNADGTPKAYWWHKNNDGQMCFGQGYMD